MNASALLTAQGWRGKGHSLHKTDDTVGLSKPLLLNRKDNTRGIGATQHFTSDQWWMNAFDEQLQGLDTSKKGKVVQTITTGKLNAIEKGSLGKYSLYTTFVRGGFLEGTIAALNKRKDSDDSDDSDDESTTEPGSDAAEKRAKKAARHAGETKEERRARKEAKRRRKEEKAQQKQERKSKKSGSKSDSSDDAAKEKRRRRARKEEKRRQRKEQDGK
ncbi:hypothetical protein ISF_08388 [Cordyceps fumosorosea ARSEF 2679]|uniref:DNA-directed RNA polymerase II subunit RPB1 n=1 Tax=Cordyceps fumosorosea (strain ARSEF 2679) TaxID=1081104 RepID=A0A162MD54_CORFA|nr:hypothetical protein ISF_08388 [Cordyceps fumosorosea ARSEF 2679]OAA54460.1 hypothetical protein ISF_08388 [Cordyceps fumosorosea ARSEF 2679]